MCKQDTCLLVESVPAQELELVWYLPSDLMELTKKIDFVTLVWGSALLWVDTRVMLVLAQEAVSCFMHRIYLQ